MDPKYITEPLSVTDLEAANAWKVAYLRRLVEQKTDPSYVQAYLETWKVSSNAVFGTR